LHRVDRGTTIDITEARQSHTARLRICRGPARHERAGLVTPIYIPLLIFLARVVDVSLGTVRTILVVGGSRWIAAAIGFVEITIWALALGGMVAYLDRPLALIGYAGGFAAGTVVGQLIEERLAIGFRAVRVVNRNLDAGLASALRARGFRVTQLSGHGRDGPVEVLLIVMRRRRVRAMLKSIGELAPDAFVTVERAERPSGGGFGRSPGGLRARFPGQMRK
jgi:uncharacterized protein YebE (UPF0316 family)